MQCSQADVVVLGVDGDSTRAIFHALAAKHSATHAILETPIGARTLVRRRLKRLGSRVVTGQILFQVLVQRPLLHLSRSRIAEIVREHALDVRQIPVNRVTRVASANDDETLSLLRTLQARVVVLSGARIIQRAILTGVPAMFVNMHSGITPRYRGVHGGYWALAEKRRDLVGTTVHVVDAGIDTGSVLEQVSFEVTSRDNFATYPYLHLAHGIPALLRQVKSALEGTIQPQSPLDPVSCLRHHPTLWGYLRGRVP